MCLHEFDTTTFTQTLTSCNSYLMDVNIYFLSGCLSYQLEMMMYFQVFFKYLKLLEAAFGRPLLSQFSFLLGDNFSQKGLPVMLK